MGLRDCQCCRGAFHDELTRCPHCWQPSLFPNVYDAERPPEVAALAARHDAAVAGATARAQGPRIEALREALACTEACKGLRRWDLDRLASSDSNLAATYYDQIRGNARVPDTDEWDRLRRIADAAAFRSYAENITFAALSLEGRWPENYGDGAVFLREETIAHRATVFEDNTVTWLRQQGSAWEVPPGFRATWERRDVLGVAKLGPRVDEHADFPQLVLDVGRTSADDSFVEVHILGGFTIRSVRKMVIRTKATSELGRACLEDAALRYAVQVEEIPG